MPCTTFCFVCFYQPAFCRVCVFILWTSCLPTNKWIKIKLNIGILAWRLNWSFCADKIQAIGLIYAGLEATCRNSNERCNFCACRPYLWANHQTWQLFSSHAASAQSVDGLLQELCGTKWTNFEQFSDSCYLCSGSTGASMMRNKKKVFPNFVRLIS